MNSTDTKKTLVQCDFDGTVTTEDVSFMLLDAFADGNWREILEEYEQGKISVGHFNREAFSMVSASKQELLDITHARVEIREGFREFADMCGKEGIPLVIVSNGLDFYIEDILRRMGLGDTRVHAALTEFNNNGLRVQYIGPDGNTLEDNLKGAYIDVFLKDYDCVIYIGNGASDLVPSRKAHHVFATGELRNRCQNSGVEYIPFTSFNDIIEKMNSFL
ncbi:MAG: MtnX-like HAD-IB family phosphatase [Dehalococcoidia bacterium]